MLVLICSLRMRFNFAFTVLLLLVVVGHGRVVAQNDEKASEQVSIYLNWTDQFQFAGYYAAVEKGYYQEAGFDVKLIKGWKEYFVDSVLSAPSSYGVGQGGMLITHARFDEITVLAAIFQQSPLALITLKSNGINILKDLEGKDIVGGTELKSMLLSAGVDISLVKIHGFTANFDELINGKYDAVSYYITDWYKMPGKDSLMFNTFRPIEYGINFYGECLFTSRVEVKNNPDRALKIREATIKGWEYAIENPDEVVDLILVKYNSGLTRQELQYESQSIIHSLILPPFYDVGDMQKSKWEQISKAMLSLGVINYKPDLNGFIYSTSKALEVQTKQLLRILAIVIISTVFIFILLIVYNRQLKNAVASRTRILEKTNSELDRFVYSVSHDIRSPLSSIQGIVNLMRVDPDGIKKYIDLVESSVKRLESFTGEILNYSRNSRTKVASKSIDFTSILDKTMASLEFSDKEASVKFNKEINCDESFHSDPWRLEVILNNVISNAIKYRNQKREDQFVSIKAKTENKTLNISIEDNGIGIDKHHLDNIFDMFYRATEDSQGSGLGLYIVYETVKLLKGQIEITSTLNMGTKVSISLPELT